MGDICALCLINTNLADMSASGTTKVLWPYDAVGNDGQVVNEGVHGAVCGATIESGMVNGSPWTNSADDALISSL